MNKSIIMGRLTKDPELRHTSNNTAVCNFTLAVERKFAKQGEEKQADFIPVTVWSKLGEFCSKYFGKGRQVVVVGRITTETWDDSEGKRQYKTYITADEAYFADSKKDSQEQKEQTGDNGFYEVDPGDELPFF